MYTYDEQPAGYCIECEKPIFEGDIAFSFNPDEYYCEDCIEDCRIIIQKTERNVKK